MTNIKVMGHCPPDTDSTCSPIAYAWYLKTFKGLDAKAFIGGDINKEAEFVLNYFNVEKPDFVEKVTSEDKLVLIDTNNPEELIEGYEDAEIIGIVDHHKLYGLKTNGIADITFRPYGCVATVIWEIMTQSKVTPTKEIAGLMASCIVSDTLNLTSPTTTDIDREALSVLAKIAEIETDEYASKMFDAKSNLDGLSERDILNVDSKNFDFGGKTYKISVLETTNPSIALSKLSELKTEMLSIIDEEKLAGFMFFVVDIIKSSAVLVTANEEDTILAEKAFSASREKDGLINLPGVVSRKKQIVPVIEKTVLA